MNPALVCRNVLVNYRRTSIRMELEFWSAVDAIAARESLTQDVLISRIDSRRGEATLTGAVRVYVLSYFRAAAELVPTTIR